MRTAHHVTLRGYPRIQDDSYAITCTTNRWSTLARYQSRCVAWCFGRALTLCSLTFIASCRHRYSVMSLCSPATRWRLSSTLRVISSSPSALKSSVCDFALRPAAIPFCIVLFWMSGDSSRLLGPGVATATEASGPTEASSGSALAAGPAVPTSASGGFTL